MFPFMWNGLHLYNFLISLHAPHLQLGEGKQLITDSFGEVDMPSSFCPLWNKSANCFWPYHELSGKGSSPTEKACSCPALSYIICFHIK